MKLSKILLFLLCLILLSGCVNIFKLSDLRKGNDISDNEAKVKQLMAEMGKAHGISHWSDFETYQVIFEDEFYGFIGKQGNPFKEQKIELSLNYIPKTFNGQLEILSGKEKGDIWGMQEWETYTKNSAGEAVFKKDKNIEFWVPTYQYFIELPNRIQEANQLAYAGQKVINGINCEGVLASWKSTAPQKDIDQYIIWINADNKQIIKVEYTVRDMYKFITGAAYYEDYKNYEGVLLPSKMPVESNLVKGLLHTMQIKDLKINQLDKESLLPKR